MVGVVVVRAVVGREVGGGELPTQQRYFQQGGGRLLFYADGVLQSFTTHNSNSISLTVSFFLNR
jgi:hypothetical protein